jgi:hypothetical protein
MCMWDGFTEQSVHVFDLLEGACMWDEKTLIQSDNQNQKKRKI